MCVYVCKHIFFVSVYIYDVLYACRHRVSCQCNNNNKQSSNARVISLAPDPSHRDALPGWRGRTLNVGI